MQRVGRQAQRRLERRVAPNPLAVIEADDRVGVIAHEQFDRRGLTRSAGEVDDDVDALADRERNPAVARREGLDRLAVDRDDLQQRLIDQQRHGARIGDVDEA